MLWALKDYAAQPSAAANNIAIVYTVDEEVAITGVRTFVKNHLPALGWRPNWWAWDTARKPAVLVRPPCRPSSSVREISPKPTHATSGST